MLSGAMNFKRVESFDNYNISAMNELGYGIYISEDWVNMEEGPLQL
jgi:hypothetical protein